LFDLLAEGRVLAESQPGNRAAQQGQQEGEKERNPGTLWFHGAEGW
jgi:hypothetical protein